MLQLDPMLPVEVISGGPTPAGKGWALLVLDYSQEHSLLWVVALNDTREVWCVPNRWLRMQENLTLGRLK